MKWRRRREADLRDEMEAHLRMAAADRIARGESPDEARHSARAEFGNVALVGEVTRQMWGWHAFDGLLQDLRYAIRTIKANPGFSTVVALTLALGIGANTAIYSMIHAALTPLAIPAADRVVVVWTENPKRDWHHFPVSAPDFRDWQSSGVFSSLGAINDDGVNVRIGDRTERIDAFNVTDGWFNALGVHPQAGRTIEAEDLQPGHDRVVVLSHEFWRSRFAADPGIIGRTIFVNGVPQTVIGILPADFPRMQHEQIYTPLVFDGPRASLRGERYFTVLGRLRPGLTEQAAQRRMDDLSRRLARQYHEDAGDEILLQPLGDALVEDAETLLVILFGAVGFLLLIACANIANLLLARSTARRKEMAIRTALGAGRWKICRQLLTESAVLALLGGVVAVLPALWAIHFVASFHLTDLHNAENVSLDASVLAFNFALALVTGLVFGLIPAWQLWKTDVNTTLKETVRSSAGVARQRLRSLVVIGEMALTLVLLAGAALTTQSFLRLRASSPGYDPHNVLTMRIALSDTIWSTPAKQAAFFSDVLGRARSLGGVQVAAAINDLPTADTLHGAGMHLQGRAEPRDEDMTMVLYNSVTTDYFHALRIPLVRGRFFTDADRAGTPLVAIIDQFTASRCWPGGDPIGRQFRLTGREPWRQVVGVVGNVSQGVIVRIMKGQVGQVYLPAIQEPKPAMTLVLRTSGNPTALIPAVRNVVRQVDLNQPLFEIQTMDEALAAGQSSQRLITCLLAGFSLTALLLAAIGIYGLIAYNVGQRMREFGIRISLGARAGNVLWLVLRQGVILAGTGAILGLLGALVVTRLISRALYGVGPADPLTLIAVTAGLGAVALLASYVPARRALRVDPIRALHYE